MTASDLPLGMRLKWTAGWTQVEADWRRTLALEPDGCFVAETEGSDVGTACTTLFGPVAWISLVLVDERWRGRGIGRALLEHAIAYCDSRRVQSIRLDATPLGRPLYASLGFRDDFELARYRGVPQLQPEAYAACEPFQSADFDVISVLDCAATGTDRSRLLRALVLTEEQPTFVLRNSSSVSGYCSMRPADGAVQIGPCIAAGADGFALVAAAIGSLGASPTIIDVPMSNALANDWLQQIGLLRQRTFTRMTRGTPVEEQLELLWASFGPEKG